MTYGHRTSQSYINLKTISIVLTVMVYSIVENIGMSSAG